MNDLAGKTINERLRLLAIFGMFAILWLHGYPLLNAPNAASWNRKLLSLLQRFSTTWAVPAFFIMSGYFFVHSIQKGFKIFYLRKCQQCLLPYFSWCLLGALLMLPLKILSNYMTHRPYLSETVFQTKQILVCLNRFFALTYHSTSVKQPLWYLRTLLVLFLFAPLFLWIYRNLPTWLLFALPFLGLFNSFHIPYLAIDLPHVSWFSLGIAVSKSGFLTWYDNISTKTIICILLCSTWLYCLLYCVDIVPIPCHRLLPPVFFPRITSLLGISVFYSMASRIHSSQVRHWLTMRFSNTFFIYCSHFPICMWIKSIGRQLFKNSDAGLIIVAVTTPFLTLCCCLLLIHLLSKYLPRIFQFLNGKRSSALLLDA